MTASYSPTIKMHPDDNVAVCLESLAAGAVTPEGLEIKQDIPARHKVATQAIPAGQAVRKYKQIIGIAIKDIAPGSHVHEHNMGMLDYERDFAIGREARPTDFVHPDKRAHFMGIVRPDGRIATRNYLGILTTVTCSATVAHHIANHFTDSIMADYPNVDGVAAFGHGTGCAMRAAGEGFDNLSRAIAGFADHPNFAGLLIVGLGCEVMQLDSLMSRMNLEAGPLLRTMNIQDMGGTRATVERGVEILKEMLPIANRTSRQKVGADQLTMGLECGGSDAYSGITANPALGKAADLLVRHGGTVVLSETTEIYGAEHLLTMRAETPEVGRKLIDRIRFWEDYTARTHDEINNNATPGNKAGGITTILEKSLGAVVKAGSTNLREVYKYAEPVREKGLVFMDTPGYDLASITGMVAGGCHLVCFTTGCGTVTGSKPAPTIKLASNSDMFNRLKDDMDLNCGQLLDGAASLDELGEQIFQLVLQTASGRRTKSELHGFGDHEFVPWTTGATV